MFLGEYKKYIIAALKKHVYSTQRVDIANTSQYTVRFWESTIHTNNGK